MDIYDFINIAESYKIGYNTSLEDKARILFDERIIFISTQYKHEKCISVCHEVMHHYLQFDKCVDLPDEVVELLAQDFYDRNKKVVDSYVRKRLK